MESSVLVRKMRNDAQLSLRALADAAGLATSTVHRIEHGTLRPTLETLQRIAEAAGVRLRIEPRLDYATSLVGLARSIREALAEGDQARPVRMAAEFVHRFRDADAERRSRMISAEPPATGDPRWDAFLGGLAEWVAVGVDMPAPGWSQQHDRFLRHGWWVTPMASMRAWEYAGSPASLQTRGVYLHRDSLTNV
jgi:transcriptional regulator with XRE-family HTH domain